MEYTIVFFTMIEVFWVKDPQSCDCCVETTVMNFLLPMKGVRVRAARNLEVGLRPTSAIISSIHCIGSTLNESGLAVVQESNNSSLPKLSFIP